MRRPSRAVAASPAERIAATVHAAYQRTAAEHGLQPAGVPPAVVPWDQLTPLARDLMAATVEELLGTGLLQLDDPAGITDPGEDKTTMTWTAHCTVTEVERDGEEGMRIALSADARHLAKPFGYGSGTVPAITSNTEGRIRAVELTLYLEQGEETDIAVGDMVTVGGHFDGRHADPSVTSPHPPAAAEADPDTGASEQEPELATEQ
jgi:hypothetical protein